MALREILVALGYELDKGQEKAVLNGISTIKKAAIGLGVAFSAKALAGFIADTVEGVARAGSEIGELAQKIGVSAQALQELAPIAAKNGASMGDLAAGLRTLSKNAFEARGGSKELQAGFAQLGVSVTDSNGNLKTSEQLLTELSDGFAGMTDETARTALAQKLLGKSGTQLIPTLLKGSAELERQRQRARELGIMDEELLKLSSDFTDAQADQASAVFGLKLAFARELLPSLVKAKKAFVEFLISLRPAAAAFGESIVRITKTVIGLVEFLGPIRMAVVALGAAFLIFGAKAAVGWLMAILPALLLGAAIFSLIDDFAAMAEGHESAIGTIRDGLLDLKAEYKDWGLVVGDVLDTALRKWLEWLGFTKTETDDWVENLTTTFENFWGTVFDFWRDKAAALLGMVPGLGPLIQAVNLFSKIVESGHLPDLLKFEGGLLRGAANLLPGGGVISAIAGAATSGALSPAAGGGASMVNQPNTNISVSVDASGASDPAAIGRATGAAVSDASDEVMLRQTNMTFTSSPAGG